MKKANQFFGYALYAIGAIKIIIVILMVITLVSSLGTIAQGETANPFYATAGFLMFAAIIVYVEIGLIIGSIVMIILNIKTS